MQCITVTDIIAGMDVYAVAGDPLRLTCQLSSDSSVDCSTPLLARSGQRPLGRRVQQRQVSESAVELVIEHVSAVDRGRYFCYTGPDDDPTPTSGVTVYVTSQFSCIIIIVVVVFCFVSELLKNNNCIVIVTVSCVIGRRTIIAQQKTFCFQVISVSGCRPCLSSLVLVNSTESQPIST